MNKEHITRGEATIPKDTIHVKIGKITYKPEVKIGDLSSPQEYEELCGVIGEANAAFIAEAFNGFNKTDKTYSELLQIAKDLQSELYLIHSQYGDKENAEDHSFALKNAKGI